MNIEDVKKGIIKKIGSTEKEIRMLQEEDCMILLMFEKLINTNQMFKLENVDTLLNERIEIIQPITQCLSFNNKGEEIKNKNDKNIITKNITETRKRKEYSVLKKYVNDRRLAELFEYFKEEEIPVEKIKWELDTYSKTKDTIFDLTFELESEIIKKDENKIIELNAENSGATKKGNIQHKPYLNWLLEKDLINNDDFSFLNMVRNTFSHNQFPQKKTIELFIKEWNDKEFAIQILNIYNKKIKELIEKIKNI